MPQITYPNQRMINIHREHASRDFLGIKNCNWMAASRVLGAHALRLYLYLAANRDGYTLALSPAAIQEAIGMPASTYRDQFRKLLTFGYLEDRGGNYYDFYETPRVPLNDKNQSEPSMMNFEEAAAVVQGGESAADNLMQENIEINNNDNFQIGKPINNYAAASSRATSGMKAGELWPDDWFMNASSFDQIIPADVANRILRDREKREQEAKRRLSEIIGFS